MCHKSVVARVADDIKLLRTGETKAEGEELQVGRWTVGVAKEAGERKVVHIRTKKIPPPCLGYRGLNWLRWRGRKDLGVAVEASVEMSPQSAAG